ncbi:MAG: VOC family protein [Armatimonadota bacterium]|nr:VOC family protein [Armatimonadota bacterium]
MNFTAHHLYLMAPGGSPADIRRFYQDALGLTEVSKPASLAHISVLWFSAGPIVFHVGHPPEGIVGDGHTALTTEDVDAARTRFSDMGYAVDDNVIPMGYPRFYVRDPWGNQFEILPTGLP